MNMGKKKSDNIVGGKIETSKLREAQTKVMSVVERYNAAQTEVDQITIQVKENWVGKGRNEFESQYNLLKQKLDDIGKTIKDINEALVNSLAEYEETDDGIRKEFVDAKGGEK